MIIGNSIIKGMVARLAGTRFTQEALAQKADLKAMRAKPTPRLRAGLGLMGFSYIIGWPAVGLLAWISYRLREPMIILVGGPAVYGLSAWSSWPDSILRAYIMGRSSCAGEPGV